MKTILPNDRVGKKFILENYVYRIMILVDISVFCISFYLPSIILGIILSMNTEQTSFPSNIPAATRIHAYTIRFPSFTEIFKIAKVKWGMHSIFSMVVGISGVNGIYFNGPKSMMFSLLMVKPNKRRLLLEKEVLVAPGDLRGK